MCVGGTVVENQKSTCLSCSVETNQNLIYKGAQTEERSLLKKRREKGRRKLGRQRVEEMMIVVLFPLYRTDSFFSQVITGATHGFFFFVSSSYDGCYLLQEMLALRPAPPSATYLHSLTTLTHSLTHIYVDIYISPSAEAGALAAMQESAKPV